MLKGPKSVHPYSLGTLPDDLFLYSHRLLFIRFSYLGWWVSKSKSLRLCKRLWVLALISILFRGCGNSTWTQKPSHFPQWRRKIGFVPEEWTQSKCKHSYSCMSELFQRDLRRTELIEPWSLGFKSCSHLLSGLPRACSYSEDTSRNQKAHSREGTKTLFGIRAQPGCKSLMKFNILTALEGDGWVLN